MTVFSNRGYRRLSVVCAAAIVIGLAGTSTARADVLRVCADPDNLPFSKSDGSDRGLYVDIADRVARELDSRAEYVWWLTYNQRRALRNTILADECDVYFALPVEPAYKTKGLIRTQGFLQLGYALVTAPSFQFTGLESLKGKRTAVQFQTPPHILLASQEDVGVTTVRSSEEALDALARDEVDAALIWGPTAGFVNSRRYQSRWRITPVAGSGLNGQVAVAVRSGQEDLAARIDQALVRLGPDIAKLADGYGLPRGTPVSLDPVESAPAQLEPIEELVRAVEGPPHGRRHLRQALSRRRSHRMNDGSIAAPAERLLPPGRSCRTGSLKGAC